MFFVNAKRVGVCWGSVTLTTQTLTGVSFSIDDPKLTSRRIVSLSFLLPLDGTLRASEHSPLLFGNLVSLDKVPDELAGDLDGLAVAGGVADITKQRGRKTGAAFPAALTGGQTGRSRLRRHDIERLAGLGASDRGWWRARLLRRAAARDGGALGAVGCVGGSINGRLGLGTGCARVLALIVDAVGCRAAVTLGLLEHRFLGNRLLSFRGLLLRFPLGSPCTALLFGNVRLAAHLSSRLSLLFLLLDFGGGLVSQRQVREQAGAVAFVF